VLGAATAALVLLAGRARARAIDAARRWVLVVRDANYNVFIDTASLKAHYSDFMVWYRTDHAQPRSHKDRPFNRELVHSLLDCRDLEFKVLAVDLSMNGGRPVSRQRTPENELQRQAWRTVVRGTSEEIAAAAACTYARRRYPSRAAR